MTESDRRIRVMLVDDQPLFRTAIATLVDGQPDMEVVGQADNGLAGVELAAQLHPDVVLLDLEMPVMNGLEAARALVARQLGTRIIVLTVADDDGHLFEALRLGVHGYLLKNLHPDQLFDQVRSVMDDHTPLSPSLVGRVVDQVRHVTSPALAGDPAPEEALSSRELQILRLAAEGLSNRDIGRSLHITEGTVKNHMHNALQKLGLANRVEATAYLVRKGLSAPRPASG